MAEPALIVRPATEQDLPAVLAIYAQPGVDDGAQLDLRDARAIFARFSRYPDYTLYVAERDGVVVGTFALLLMDNLGHLGAPSAVVEDVAVAPAQQGNGIGQAMMRAAFAKAHAKGCYKVALSANMKRERAHAFYEALGFERHGYSFRIDPREVAS
jgi:ribosomal protein S18 acetylase RimI-like enzyme